MEVYIVVLDLAHFFLMFGREMRMPLELVLPTPDADEDRTSTSPDTLDGFVVTRMSQTFEHIYSLTRQHLRSALAMQKNSYDKKKE